VAQGIAIDGGVSQRCWQAEWDRLVQQPLELRREAVVPAMPQCATIPPAARISLSPAATPRSETERARPPMGLQYPALPEDLDADVRLLVSHAAARRGHLLGHQGLAPAVQRFGGLRVRARVPPCLHRGPNPWMSQRSFT